MIGNNGILKAIKDIIGTLSDLIAVPFVFGADTIMAHLNTNYYHVHGATFIYPLYAAPVTLTSVAAAWGEPATPTEIMPINTITKDFDLHWASISDISAVLDGIIDLYGDNGSGWVFIGPLCDVVRTSNFSREDQIRVQVPQLPANLRLGCKFRDSTTSIRTVRIKIYGHVYSDSLT